MGRILTTIVPLNTPAGWQERFVLYIGTLTPSSIWRTGMSASSRAASNEKLHPDQKADKVVPLVKIMRYIGRFLGQNAVAVDAVARDVAGNIAARRKLGEKLRAPASATSNSGQALGLRWQNKRKSHASALGSTTRLPCA